MRVKLILFMICGFIACAPINQFYGAPVSNLPYLIIFDDEERRGSYKIKSQQDRPNILDCVLPDSVQFDSGDAVAEVKLNSNNDRINKISVIGMTIYDKQTDSVTGFDFYNQKWKRVVKVISPRFMPYVQVAKNRVQQLDFVTIKNEPDRKVFVKLLFKKQN